MLRSAVNTKWNLDSSAIGKSKVGPGHGEMRPEFTHPIMKARKTNEKMLSLPSQKPPEKHFICSRKAVMMNKAIGK